MQPFFQATPGITEPKFSRDPLGTEGELTPGPDDENPFEDNTAETVETATDTGGPPSILGAGGESRDIGAAIMGEITEEASERHGRAMSFFEPARGHGSLDTDPEPLPEHFRW